MSFYVRDLGQGNNRRMKGWMKFPLSPKIFFLLLFVSKEFKLKKKEKKSFLIPNPLKITLKRLY
jgi:hypothetical protein